MAVLLEDQVERYMCGAVEGVRAREHARVVIGYHMGGGLAPHRGTGMTGGPCVMWELGRFNPS